MGYLTAISHNRNPAVHHGAQLLGANHQEAISLRGRGDTSTMDLKVGQLDDRLFISPLSS